MRHHRINDTGRFGLNKPLPTGRLSPNSTSIGRPFLCSGRRSLNCVKSIRHPPAEPRTTSKQSCSKLHGQSTDGSKADLWAIYLFGSVLRHLVAGCLRDRPDPLLEVECFRTYRLQQETLSVQMSHPILAQRTCTNAAPGLSMKLSRQRLLPIR